MDRITDRPDMTSAVDHGRKALTQTNHMVEVFAHQNELHQEKTCFCKCKNKGTDQLHGYSAFVFITQTENPSTSLIQNVKPSTIFLGCTAWFVSELVGNQKDRYSQDVAQMVLLPLKLEL